ncbi:MAG: hypothetical protein CVT66_04150 [Actinobacteria bacterium HGW-Actinobacteria-6]|jgi:O-antigen ligase|nr:MAG: hypothetical protein CVT66_04150 [Actinobacteria bacterium HGW-Actinobacteria-6]
MGRVRDVFTHLGFEAKVYVILFVATLFSGSLYGIVAPYFIVIEIALLFWMCVQMPGKRPMAYFNRSHYVQFAILVVFSLFLLWQVPHSYVSSIGWSYVRRFLVFSLMFLMVPRPEVAFSAIKASKYYSLLVAVSIVIATLLTGEKTGGLVGSYQYGGMMMSVACILFLVDYFIEEGRSTDALGFTISLVALLISGKRMFALLVVVAFVLLYALSRRRAGVVRAARLLAAGAIIVLPLYYWFAPVRELAQRLQLLTMDPGSATSGRNLLWAAAWETFRSHSLTGIGFGNFAAWIGANYDTRTIGQYMAHNIYYGLLAETGIVGFVLVVGLLVVSLIQSIPVLLRFRREESALLYYVLTVSVAFQLWFVVYGLTGNGIYNWHEMFLYVSALAMMISVQVHMRTAVRGEWNATLPGSGPR